jgi:hypothetical protein
LPIVDTEILTSGSADPLDSDAGADPQSPHPPHAPVGLTAAALSRRRESERTPGIVGTNRSSAAARVAKPGFKLRGPSEMSA